MRVSRQWRNLVNRLVGVRGDLQVWWTTELPLIYIDNPKAGCSTIKYSLKKLQADAYRCRQSSPSGQISASPHASDNFLRKRGLSPSACRERYLISCVRNPFTRALSGYLDKVVSGDPNRYPELRNKEINSFEAHLKAVAEYPQSDLDRHFRPQHLNLDYPRLSYDAVFFLENLPPLGRFLEEIHAGPQLEKFAPHSRGANAKLRQHYTDGAIALAREIYALDFAVFGYSTDLADVGAAPGAYIDGNSALLSDVQEPLLPERPIHAEIPGLPFEKTLRYRRLIDMRLL